MGRPDHRHRRRRDPPHRAGICSDAGPNALAHNGWRTSNFVNSFQTERAITILNALVGNWGDDHVPAGGEDGGALGKPPQPPYPRISALRLDGVPWKYPFVPFKLGIFQEMRDNVLEGKPYQAHGWFIARQNPVAVAARPARTLEAFNKMDFIAMMDIIPERHRMVCRCGPARSVLPGTLRSAAAGGRQGLCASR